MFVLENALYLIMSQAMRYLREPAMSSREKQLLKRELSAELVSLHSCPEVFYVVNVGRNIIKQLLNTEHLNWVGIVAKM